MVIIKVYEFPVIIDISDEQKSKIDEWIKTEQKKPKKEWVDGFDPACDYDYNAYIAYKNLYKCNHVSDMENHLFDGKEVQMCVIDEFIRQ